MVLKVKRGVLWFLGELTTGSHPKPKQIDKQTPFEEESGRLWLENSWLENSVK